jgi:hypothetical protein
MTLSVSRLYSIDGRVINEHGSDGGKRKNWQGILKYYEKTCLSATFSATNPPWPPQWGVGN